MRRFFLLLVLSSGWSVACLSPYRIHTFHTPPSLQRWELRVAVSSVIVRPSETCLFLQFSNLRKQKVSLHRALLKLRVGYSTFSPMTWAELMRSYKYNCSKKNGPDPRHLHRLHQFYPARWIRFRPGTSRELLVCYPVLIGKRRFEFKVERPKGFFARQEWPEIRLRNLKIPTSR